LQHGPGIFYSKYEARNTPAPFCYVVGGDPIINFAAGTTLPSGVCEADYAGGFRQEPLKVVRAETNNLYVPADAEIVIEGVMMPHERLDEGPQGEYTGYVHGRAPMPVYHVRCITYRDNPIIPYAIGGCTYGDEQSLSHAMSPVEVYRNLREFGFPVKDVRFLTELLWDGLVISTEIPYDGYVHELAAFIESHKIALWGNQRIIVDADVDISDEDAMERIYQEMGTRIDPKRNIIRTDNDVFATPLTPLLNAAGRKTGIGQADLTWNCTTPFSWKKGDKIKPVEMKNLFADDVRNKAREVYETL
jgi:4-hydroxy-3-polyprenylbenzoate decarboxylase